MTAETTLEQITQYAELQFSPEEVGLLMRDPDLAVAMQKKGTAEYESYRRGLLMAAAVIRRAIYTQAKSGSTVAQEDMQVLIESKRHMRG